MPMTDMPVTLPRPMTAPDVPLPKGHYSHAMEAGGLVHISGQLPVGPGDMDFEAQVRSAMASLLAIVTAAGGSAANLVKVTAYIVGIANWGDFNRVYAEIMGEAKPARAIVPVPELHYGYLVEIDAVAAL
jgi:2-iminobutanoate/2-iminopropanoate deaminase